MSQARDTQCQSHPHCHSPLPRRLSLRLAEAPLVAGRLFFLSWLWSWQQQQQQRSSAEGALGLAVAARSTACLQGTGSVASEQRKPLKVTCTVEGGG